MARYRSVTHATDEELDAARLGEVSAHIAACAECRARVDEMRAWARSLAEAPRVDVPAEVDEFMADAARMAARRLGRRRVGRVAAWIAPIAAAAAAALWLMARPTVRPEDVNADGRVDILDAFALARRLQASAGAQARWDFNHDGVVDAADVDWLARAVVSLGGHG